MKRNFSLFQQFIARLLLISLCLQSCGVNPPIANIQPLVGKELIAQGGHKITIYGEAGIPKADVEINLPQGFRKIYEGVNIYVEQGTEIANLSQLDKQAQQRCIHFQSAQVGQPARVIIYKNAGLIGGSTKGKEKITDGKQVHTEEKEPILNDLDKQELLKLATEENEAEAQFLLGKQAYDLWREDVRNEVSYKEAIKWLEKARSQEYQAAIALLEELKEIKEQENSGLDIFPAEIWQDIFSHLDTKGVLTARLVSCFWNKLLTGSSHIGLIGVKNIPSFYIKNRQNWTLNKKIDFMSRRLNGLTLETIPSFAFYHLMGNVAYLPRIFWPHLRKTNIHELTIRNIYDSRIEELIKHLQGTNVHTLSLTCSRITDKGIELLAKHLPGTNIHTLYVNLFKITDKGMGALAKALKYTKVHTLYLTESNIDYKLLEILTANLAETNVQRLYLAESEIGKEGVELWARHLKRTKLHTLDLYANSIGGEGACILVQHLREANIHSLLLYNTNIRNKRIESLGRALQSTSIRTLDLSENEKIGIKGIVELVKHLQGTQVHTLNLRHNNLKDKGMVDLADNLQGTKVHTLDLSGNDIGDQGAVEFAKHLQGTQIHTVDLSWNKIGDQGAVGFARALQETQVHTVDLEENDIGGATQQALREQYSHIKWKF